jgi:PAS domain S-box-containing protein
MKSAFLDKLIEKLDKLDPQSLQSQILRLIKEKGLLETVFNAIHEGIIVLDQKGNIQYANNAAGNMLGVSVEDVVNQPIKRFLKEVDWQSVMRLDSSAWAELVNSELEITYPEKRYLNFYIMPLEPDEEGSKKGGAILLLRDVTQERQKTADAVNQERLNAITLLTAGVAHEIGNPLNSLGIHLQLLAREIKELPSKKKKELEKLVTTAREEVARLDNIITQFLKAIRPTQPNREKADILKVLKETVNFLKYELNNKDIVAELKAEEDLPEIAIDSQQIRQAFFNIIKNAIEAMKPGGLLTINVFSTDKHIGISFKDTGKGFSAEDLSKMFKPFASDKKGGTGIGLMIVQRIVHDHGGEIEVHTRPGSGTTFTVLLPLGHQKVKLLKAPSE